MKRQSAMEGQRGVWEQHWREIARRVLPYADLFSEERTPGEKRTEYLYDATAMLALEKFAAALDSMLTPRSEMWHELAHPDSLFRDDVTSNRYFDDLNHILFAARYDNDANFSSNIHQVYMQLGAFGTGALMVEDDRKGGIRYRALHLGEFWIAEDWQGRVDTFHRKYKYTVRQAAQRWGEDKLPEKLKGALKNEPDRQFEFIHCIKPNDERKRDRNDYRGMAFASYHVCCETRTLMGEGGYRTWPVPVSRYVQAPREVYGRSVAMSVLPDIKMLNEMSKTSIMAAQKALNPPLMLPDDGVLASFQTVPGSLNFGGVDSQGRPLVLPLETGLNLPVGLEMENQRREVINDAFLVRLFQILVDAPAMTATEVLERAREKGTLLAPTVGRQQSELLGPLIQRELDILASNDRIPPPPEELVDGEDLVFEIEYDSPLNRAMKADQAIAVIRTLEVAQGMAAFDPGVLNRFNLDEALQTVAKANGMPPKIMRSDDEVKALAEQQAQAQQAQMMAQMATEVGPAVGKTVKDLAQAGVQI